MPKLGLPSQESPCSLVSRTQENTAPPNSLPLKARSLDQQHQPGPGASRWAGSQPEPCNWNLSSVRSQVIGIHTTVCRLHLSVPVTDHVPGSDPARPGLAGPPVADQRAALPGPSSTGHERWVEMAWPLPTWCSRKEWARNLSAEGLPQDCGTASQKLHAHWLTLP